MFAPFLAALIAFSSPAGTESETATERAERTAAIYDQWLPLAEALEQHSFDGVVDLEVASRHRTETGLPADLIALLQARKAERTRALFAVFETHDPVALLDQAPQTANFLTRVVRADPDAPISDTLMARFEPLSGSPALHPTVFESLRAQRAFPAPSTWAVGETPADPAATRQFLADRARLDPYAEILGRASGRDQFIRAVFVPQLADLGSDAQPFIDAFRPVIEAVDAETNARARDLLDTPGFAALHRASTRLSESVVSLIHHGGSSQDRRELLELIEPLALAGEFSGQRYALMYDRLAEQEGRPQRFGTQDSCVNGRRGIYQLEDRVTVDQLRASLGLMPLAEYRALLIDQYGESC